MDSKTPSSAAWNDGRSNRSIARSSRNCGRGSTARQNRCGALGRLEDLAVQLGRSGIRCRRTPETPVFVFAADHGITDEGVSLYPASVTAAMVATYLAGRAGVNVLARASDVDVRVIDAGVDADIPAHPGLIDAKFRRGSRNAAREPAMTIGEAQRRPGAGRLDCRSCNRGRHRHRRDRRNGHRQHHVGCAVDAPAGAGAAGRLRRRRRRSRCGRGRAQAWPLPNARPSRSNATAPLEVLSEFGGYEIAMMAGAVIGSAVRRRPVIIDGFIATAAALVALRLRPAARDYCVFSHRSAERGHSILLEALDANPYLDLGMRLGEGTGAVMAVPLLRAAGGILNEMADLSDVHRRHVKAMPAGRRHHFYGRLIFLTGPTRSGKSRRAVEIAQGWGDGVVFVATYRADPRRRRNGRAGRLTAPSARRHGARWRHPPTLRRRWPICGRRRQAR